MYFKIMNGDCIQLSGSDNKVTILENTTISGNLDVGVGAWQTTIKAYAHHAGHQGNVEIEARWNSHFLFIL